jgi:hypothetical protein
LKAAQLFLLSQSKGSERQTRRGNRDLMGISIFRGCRKCSDLLVEWRTYLPLAIDRHLDGVRARIVGQSPYNALSFFVHSKPITGGTRSGQELLRQNYCVQGSHVCCEQESTTVRGAIVGITLVVAALAPVLRGQDGRNPGYAPSLKLRRDKQ